ncbi:poly(U)-specific 3'-to-5' RNA exonuclease [Borealophlyctis nickersoniae]|nr:poly(U)-specific 3'-to-5' RNA exonuclease [Borealophlyctis nickersoniae]
MTGIDSLVDYSSSDESDKDVTMEDVPTDKGKAVVSPTSKRPLEEAEKETAVKRRRTKESKLPPLPDNFMSMFGDAGPKRVDDPQQHCGRVRSIPHVEGNWATFAHVSFELPLELDDIVARIIYRAREKVPNLIPLDQSKKDAYHISLSRTVFLKVFQIDRFTELLGKKMEGKSRFNVCFTKITRYMNEERTRSFLSLDVGAGKEHLVPCVKDVDEVMTQFRQKPFFKHSKMGSKTVSPVRLLPNLNRKFGV